MQDINGLRRKSDSLDPWRKRLQNAGLQMVENFMTQLGQTFCQNVVNIVARTGWEFPRPATGTILKTRTILMVRPEEYPHELSIRIGAFPGFRLFPNMFFGPGGLPQFGVNTPLPHSAPNAANVRLASGDCQQTMPQRVEYVGN